MLESSGSYASSDAGFSGGLYRLHIGGGGPLCPRPWTFENRNTKTYWLVFTTQWEVGGVTRLQEAKRKKEAD